MSAAGLWENRDVDQGRKRAQTAAAAAAAAIGLISLQCTARSAGTRPHLSVALFIESHTHDLPPHPLLHQ